MSFSIVKTKPYFLVFRLKFLESSRLRATNKSETETMKNVQVYMILFSSTTEEHPNVSDMSFLFEFSKVFLDGGTK